MPFNFFIKGENFNENMKHKPFLKTIKNIYGIGVSKTNHFINFYGLNPHTNPKYIKKNYSNNIKKDTNIFLIERLLKTNIKNNITFLLENKTYKGLRHKLKYPVRGQRTRTNAKTTKKKK